MSLPKHLVVASKDVKAFPAWLTKVATSTHKKYSALRSALCEESAAHDPRRTAMTFLTAIHAQFPSMQGCYTDVSCLHALFESALTKKNAETLITSVNVVVGLQLGHSINSYPNKISHYRKCIRKKLGESKSKELEGLLVVAGGSICRAEAKHARSPDKMPRPPSVSTTTCTLFPYERWTSGPPLPKPAAPRTRTNATYSAR
jgi:hypothetical protein